MFYFKCQRNLSISYEYANEAKNPIDKLSIKLIIFKLFLAIIFYIIIYIYIYVYFIYIYIYIYYSKTFYVVFPYFSKYIQYKQL